MTLCLAGWLALPDNVTGSKYKCQYIWRENNEWQTMDDLLALFDEDEKIEQQEQDLPDTRTSECLSRETTRKEKSRQEKIANDPVRSATRQASSKPTSTTSALQESLSSTGDAKLGLRMKNRLVSGSELLDILSLNYHSPASLAVKSLTDLNQLLIEPAAIVNSATVVGNAAIVTAGVVFSNSGTRMSSAGNAYCVLSIGNLQTGPVVSVFCFGNAYRRVVQAANAGKVVCVQHPRILGPGKQPSKTALTLSVNDESKILIVADARDYGRCQGRNRGKDPVTGKWVDTAKRCLHHVDTRVSLFCRHHQKQGKQSEASIGNTKFATASLVPTKMVQLKAEAQMRNRLQEKVTNIPATKSYNLLPQYQPRTTASHTSLLNSRNTLLNPVAVTPSVKNPYARPMKPVINRTSLSATSHNKPSIPQQQNTARTDDWLQSALGYKRCRTALVASSSAPKKQRKINTDNLTTFSGSVAVPKPRQFFLGGSLAKAGVSQPVTANNQRTSRDITDAIRRQQRQIVEQMAQQQNSTSVVQQVKKQVKPPKASNKRNTPSGLDSFFTNEEQNSFDVHAVLNAKSRFSMEADAEEYARARNALQDLEENEMKSQKRDKNKGKRISSQWRCTTCSRMFSYKPMQCVRARHQVQQQRQIQEHQASKTEQRLQLASKDASNGGLRLGSGVEWSYQQRWGS